MPDLYAKTGNKNIRPPETYSNSHILSFFQLIQQYAELLICQQTLRMEFPADSPLQLPAEILLLLLSQRNPMYIFLLQRTALFHTVSHITSPDDSL